MKLVSTFAILDVKKGRKKLNKRLIDRPLFQPCPEELRVPVTVTGYISGVWGNDDGESQEFEMEVENVEVHLNA